MMHACMHSVVEKREEGREGREEEKEQRGEMEGGEDSLLPRVLEFFPPIFVLSKLCATRRPRVVILSVRYDWCRTW